MTIAKKTDKAAGIPEVRDRQAKSCWYRSPATLSVITKVSVEEEVDCNIVTPELSQTVRIFNFGAQQSENQSNHGRTG